MDYRRDEYLAVPWMPEERDEPDAEPAETRLTLTDEYATGFKFGVIVGAVVTAAMLAICSLL